MEQTTNKTSDVELFKRFCAGQESAFQELVERYRNSLYMFLSQFLNQRDLVEDVFQETFLQLYVSRDSFDLSRPLRPWLFTIAANKAKDALRKQQRISAMPIGTVADSGDMSFDDVLNAISSDKTNPYDNLARDELSAQVREIIGDMPENLREILILAYFNKFSYKQMADLLSIPIGTVKSRLHTAVGRFCKEWNSKDGNKNKG
ncbi:MAG: RNA polymerase sigma factor [Planctomycetota bacterium]|jgi:RNA polymerase sigma-70 factor (ECF subfamily)